MHATTIIPTLMPEAGLLLVTACLDALRGRRALHQIRPRMARPAFECLIRHAAAPLTSAAVGRIRVQMPHASAIEASTLVECDDTWLACTMRLDGHEETGWVCTDFRLIGPGTA